jgi:hypothetical protein
MKVSRSIPLIFLALACSIATYAQGVEPDIESLRGLDTVDIAVYASDQAQRVTQSDETIRLNMRIQLSRAGIPVVAAPIGQKVQEGQPLIFIKFLTVPIGTNKNGESMLAAAIEFSLEQPVSLIRRPTYKTNASTWGRNSLFVMKAGDLEPLFAMLEWGAKEFAKDYLSVNPKKSIK